MAQRPENGFKDRWILQDAVFVNMEHETTVLRRFQRVKTCTLRWPSSLEFEKEVHVYWNNQHGWIARKTRMTKKDPRKRVARGRIYLTTWDKLRTKVADTPPPQGFNKRGLDVWLSLDRWWIRVGYDLPLKFRRSVFRFLGITFPKRIEQQIQLLTLRTARRKYTLDEIRELRRLYLKRQKEIARREERKRQMAEKAAAAKAKKQASKKTTKKKAAKKTVKKKTTKKAKGSSKKKASGKTGRSMVRTVGTALESALKKTKASTEVTRAKKTIAIMVKGTTPSHPAMERLRDDLNDIAMDAREANNTILSSKLSTQNRLVRRIERSLR